MAENTAHERIPATRLAVALALALVVANGPAAAADGQPAALTQCPTATDEPAAGTPPAIPFGQGLLFRVERDGVAASHLFGTIHLDDRHLHQLPPQLSLALLQANRVLMETALDEAAQAQFAGSMSLPAGQTLAQWLGGDVLDRYRRLIEFYRVPEATAMQLKPWAATSLVGRPRASSGRTMEDVIRETALQMGKPVEAMETMDELIAAIEEQPIDDQLTVLVDTVCQHRRIMEDAQALLAMYAEGDLAAIAWQNEHGHEDDPVFQWMNERILYRRSEQMVERMRPALAAGGAVVAVGALHLTGERGLLRLLEKQGYRITRVF